jgi:polyhydroxyalkanoate synthesis repressor PhaR
VRLHIPWHNDLLMLHCSIRYECTTRGSCVKIFAVQHRGEIPKMGSNPVIIKKYGNRRMYDTSASRYVNLEDLAGMIRDGKEVKVVDAKTGEDLTRLTLSQIISEDVKDKPTGLPLELLRQLIVASDQARQEFMMWYLRSAFDTYEKVQSALQTRLTDVQSAITTPLESMKRFLDVRPAAESESELQALRKRLADLEARLNQNPNRKPRRHRKTQKARS